jgi:hypothetical protein
MKTIQNNKCEIQEYLHQSAQYGSKVLWKVYKPNGRLWAVCQSEEGALQLTSRAEPHTLSSNL